MLASLPPLYSVVYFDAGDFALRGFFGLLRKLVQLKGGTDFAVIALEPDPFFYFYRHFKKYPAFIVQGEHSLDDYFAFLYADPGESPADALRYNAQQYAILPMCGSWFILADRGSEVGQLVGRRDIVEFSRSHYPYLFNEEDDLYRTFKVETGGVLRDLTEGEILFIRSIANRLKPATRSRLLSDLDLARAEELFDDASLIRFHFAGYERCKKAGQSTYPIEGRLNDADGATVHLLLFADPTTDCTSLNFCVGHTALCRRLTGLAWSWLSCRRSEG
jgi:hypothetical protein